MRKLTIEEVKDRIRKVHGDSIVMIDSTFVNTYTNALFVDSFYNKTWASTPKRIMRGETHKGRGNAKSAKTRSLPVEEVKNRIQKAHGDTVSIVENTYISFSKHATFYDVKFGFWESCVQHILEGHCHPDRGKENQKKTLQERYGIDNPSQSKIFQEKKKKTWYENYGVDNPSKNAEIMAKISKNIATNVKMLHWKTGQELVCQGSWEVKTVEYFNTNRMDFEWQPRVFKMPNGKTYRPDTYLPDQGIWVEIKGRFIGDAQEKWDWFKTVYPTAQLWNKKKLHSIGIKVI